MKRKITIFLSEQEEELVNWMAKNYKHTFQEELQSMFYLQLREDMEHYSEEMKMEKKGEQK